MEAKFISTEGAYLEAVVEIDGHEYSVMDDFGGEKLESGDVINIEIIPGLLNEAESWETVFSSNPNNERKLEKIDGWRYRAFGVIKSIKPVVVDCGVLEIDAPFSSNDPRVIGSSVSFTVERLDAS